MSKEAEQFVCKRCGNCCIDVGRTFWKSGNCKCDCKPFGEIDTLNRWALNGDHEDGELPCEMLDMTDGLATCLIEKKYGYEAKTLACREHEGGERCKGIE